MSKAKIKKKIKFKDMDSMCCSKCGDTLYWEWVSDADFPVWFTKCCGKKYRATPNTMKLEIRLKKGKRGEEEEEVMTWEEAERELEQNRDAPPLPDDEIEEIVKGVVTGKKDRRHKRNRSKKDESGSK